jgi:hypothetical protein
MFAFFTGNAALRHATRSYARTLSSQSEKTPDYHAPVDHTGQHGFGVPNISPLPVETETGLPNKSVSMTELSSHPISQPPSNKR